jgi:hypothetical protein
MIPLPFAAWKRELFESAGSASAPVVKIGDYVLELFWRDGCEPTITALLDYAQAGLRPAAVTRAQRAERSSATSLL